MTYRDLINDAIKKLSINNIVDSDYDAKQILLNLLDIDMSNYLLNEDRDLESFYTRNTISNILEKFDELIDLRSKHFPLQYILGEQYFYGIRFEVNEDVLIPRSDTETLVETVLNENNNKNISILDMCTGSGCIAITLAKLGGYKTVVASDISREAIDIASENAESILDNDKYNDEMDQHVYFLQSNMFSNVKKIKDTLGYDKFDIITCNPPYIKTDDIWNLDEEVRKYEPHIALDGDRDGLKYYKILAKESKQFLNDNGKMYIEIGFDQGKDVKKLFEKEGYKDINIVKDIENRDRVLVVKV